MNSTIDKEEVKKFSDIADQWWDPNGKFKLLHKINPVRLSYFREKIIQHFSLDDNSLKPFEGLRFLDVGCGGGLISQSLAKMGADVVAIDASEKNIEVAKRNNHNHVEYIAEVHENLSTESTQKSPAEVGLCKRSNHAHVEYIATSIEDLNSDIEKFDCIFIVEILEHVADLELFVEKCTDFLKPGGMIISSTLNKTFRSYIKAIIMAEYVLNFLPKKTHDWQKFIKPSSLSSIFRKYNLEISELKGMSYNILQDKWYISDEIDTNYIAIYKNR